MTLKLLIVTYVIGGLTFLPLLALAVFTILFYSSPIAEHKTSNTLSPDDERVAKEHGGGHADGAASATFAVLRRYDFQSATAALKDASNITEKAEAGGDGQNAESVSVYQTMYRTVFDRNRNASNPLQESEDTVAQKNKAKSAGRVFYVVLRHGHLMLYDSAVQFEVRHVVSLSHYSISLQDDITSRAADFLESDVFTRRTALVLTPLDRKSGKKPYFLFGDVNIEKEDFYFALLTSTAHPPVPRPLDIESTIKLQSALHSSSLSPESRALNALLGRVFLAMHRTPFLEAFVRHKIETKMARIPKPAFLASMACHALDLGNAAPVLSNARLKEINISGETVIALDVKYSGGVNITIAAAAKLDLGPRFKTRMVSLLLAVVLQRLQGKMLIKIKPPPSNRIWFCFETMPDMELKIEPVVSSRQITYAFVLRAIEARIREAFAEGLVQPNWDDVPFFATQEQRWRGGIWESEGVEDVAQEEKLGETVADVHPLSQNSEKSSSLPGLPTESVSTGAEADDLGNVKRRSTAKQLSQVAKTAAEKAHALATEKQSIPPVQPVRPPRSLRSPSLVPATPLVAVDDSSADAVRGSDATTPTRRRWIGRNNLGQTQKLDVADIVRQVRDRDTLVRKNSSNENLQATLAEGDDVSEEVYLASQNSQDVLDQMQVKSRTVSLDDTSFEGRHLRGASTDSAITAQRKTILASTAAATAAARQWTWNAVANRTKGQALFSRNGAQSQTAGSIGDLPDIVANQAQSQRKQALPSGPIGRGRPLPPPGKPLPGPPSKGIWSAAASGLGNIRKKAVPVQLPRQAIRTDHVSGEQDQSLPASQLASDIHGPQSESADVAYDPDGELPTAGDVDGEYGPWMTNDVDEQMITDDLIDLGAAKGEQQAEEDSFRASQTEMAESVAKPTHKKMPPPLPRRPVNKQTSTNTPSESQAEDAPASVVPQELRLNDVVDETATVEDMSHADVSHHVSRSTPDLLGPNPPEALHSTDSLPDHLDGDDGDSASLEAPDDFSDQEDLPTLADDVQAIPAPADAEAEETGILDLAEDHVVADDEDSRLEVLQSASMHVSPDDQVSTTEPSMSHA